LVSSRNADGVPDAFDALMTASELGPFFSVDSWADGEHWRALGSLVADSEVLLERVTAARDTLATFAGVPAASIETRATASTVFLGLVARLVSPPLATAALAGVIPELTVEGLWWRPVQGGPWPIATSPAVARCVVDLGDGLGLERAAQVFSDVIVSGVVAPLQAAFAKRFEISRQVLWGNVASALGGALGMIATARPDKAADTAALVGRLLEIGRLRGTSELVRPDPSSERRFLVRQSCCLFYRVPGGGLCADCVLTPEDVRRRQWQAALRRGP
jgi:FhuF 2Fe-2S C-terminal domain